MEEVQGRYRLLADCAGCVHDSRSRNTYYVPGAQTCTLPPTFSNSSWGRGVVRGTVGVWFDGKSRRMDRRRYGGTWYGGTQHRTAPHAGGTVPA